ncbi:MAG: Molybdopterin biosynthesis enzyme MoaB [Candidatus Methanohalarchaeum thermophilum]|uniref:Molybdopterin biosynthesis enzyme MoaB n=1 Tax=Methanohalarchaeum thermophilum TaxID=1903181 RepID=A0A1Q6DWI7_METT1|nr:MAG: Molybdopterin biosynthesis enzyme MoaB [Candidatus Methanohalarchaeum thermophilum]
MTHKHQKETECKIKIITVSDTRNIEKDKSGDKIQEILNDKKHTIDRTIIKDNKTQIINKISQKYDLIIYCGGTGISKRDVTVEAIKPLLDKEITGFAQYFRSKSFEEVGSRAILTRAIGGVINNTLVFALPGSVNAAKTGAKIIKKELNHLMYHIKQ